MNRKLNQTSCNGSLDLLLDTLCNVFGGIVLIACLLAIMPRHNTPPPLLPERIAESQMVERRIQSAKDEINRVNIEIAKLSETTDPILAELQERRDSLARTTDKLEKEQKQRTELESSRANAESIVNKGDVDALKERLADLQLEKTRTENLNRTTRDKIKFLEERLKNLTAEALELAQGRVQAVRFPREKNAKGDPIPMIIQFNSAYPLALGAALKNNPAIERVIIPGQEAFLAKPIAGRGIVNPKDNKELLATFRRSKKEGAYISLYLYPDSHQIFADVRDALAASKVGYGLEFVDKGRNLVFSQTGSAPPEL